MEIPKFQFDFSFLDLDELRSQCITTDEVESVFYHPNTKYEDFGMSEDFRYMIGYSLKNKFISFTFEMRDDFIRITSVYLSYEREIWNRYYGG